MLALKIIALILLTPGLLAQLLGLFASGEAGAETISIFSILGTIAAIVTISISIGVS